MTRSKKRFFTIDMPDEADYAVLCQSLWFGKLFTWKRDWVSGAVMFDKCKGRDLARALQKLIDAGETTWGEILGLYYIDSPVSEEGHAND